MHRISLKLFVNSLYSHTETLATIESLIKENAGFALDVTYGYANDDDATDIIYRLIDEDKYQEAQIALDQLRMSHCENPELVKIQTQIFMLTNII